MFLRFQSRKASTMFDIFRFPKPRGRSKGRGNQSRQHRSGQHRRLLCEALETRTLLSGLALIQQAKLTASDGAANAVFGRAVAVSGNTMVVGAYHATVGGIEQGAAYVFTESGSTWTQTAELTASDGAAGNLFGMSVSISGNTLVVGADEATVGGIKQGAAYVFTESGSAWTQTAELTPSDGAAGDGFGGSVAISADDTIVVGAYSAAVGGNADQGAAYVFTEPASGWVNTTQTAKLTASDGAAHDQFGESVAIDSATDTVVAGAYNATVGGNSGQGAAYVFTAPASGWVNATQTATLTASDGAAGAFFGRSVSISDSTLVVGANEATVGGNATQGAAYVFTEPSGGWAGNLTQTAKLTSSDGRGGDDFGVGELFGDGFGDSVSISGSTVVVGAANAWGGNIGQGAAYVFTEPASGWANMTQTQKLTASDGAAGDAFGGSVSISGGTVVAGATGATVGGNALQGAAYVFGSAPLGLSQTSIPPDTVNVAYNQTIAAVGGTGTVTLAVSKVSGAIKGLTVPSSGTGSLAISGTPTATGTETFTVTATDSAGDTASGELQHHGQPGVDVESDDTSGDRGECPLDRVYPAQRGHGQRGHGKQRHECDPWAYGDPLRTLAGRDGRNRDLRHAHGHGDGDHHRHGHRRRGRDNDHELLPHGHRAVGDHKLQLVRLCGLYRRGLGDRRERQLDRALAPLPQRGQHLLGILGGD